MYILKKKEEEIRGKVTVHLQFTISPYFHSYVTAGFSFLTSVSWHLKRERIWY